jgi:hypothetical protein
MSPVQLLLHPIKATLLIFLLFITAPSRSPGYFLFLFNILPLLESPKSSMRTRTVPVLLIILSAVPGPLLCSKKCSLNICSLDEKRKKKDLAPYPSMLYKINSIDY